MSCFTRKPGQPALPRCLLATTLALFCAAATAQSTSGQSPSASKAETVQELKTKRQEIRQLVTELRDIQRKVTADSPELQSQQQEFRRLVIDSMAGDNYQPETEMKRIRALQSKLQNGEQMTGSERRKKVRQLQDKQRQFRNRQHRALQTEDVKNARRELDENMQAAMEQRRPELAGMVAQLNELRREYHDLLRAIRPRQEDGTQAGQG